VQFKLSELIKEQQDIDEQHKKADAQLTCERLSSIKLQEEVGNYGLENEELLRKIAEQERLQDEIVMQVAKLD
jgi:hypothetical protein